MTKVPPARQDQLHCITHGRVGNWGGVIAGLIVMRVAMDRIWMIQRPRGHRT